ncbi:hypothetical protein G7Y89_g11398 [Cudoniella acicularis]|uniref:DUF7918 domain-containing protein n=1 Tax=Cudoniella acicularis TaxID=354080 RepID=A0A8H4VXW3_9HELO|nr:hypothetical protein G7Y89_g11398 [Cudoniella acicularis]
MAIHELIPGVEVAIIVDGVPLEEYVDDEVDRHSGQFGEQRAARTVSKYIEAVTGKEFSIRVKLDTAYKPDCPSLGFNYFVDGVLASRRLFRNMDKPRLGLQLVEGVRNTEPSGHTTLKPFKFSEINTYDNKFLTVAQQVEQIAKVGEIIVEFHQALKQLLVIACSPEPETHSVSDTEEPVDFDQLDDEQRREAENFVRQLKASQLREIRERKSTLSALRQPLFLSHLTTPQPSAIIDTTPAAGPGSGEVCKPQGIDLEIAELLSAKLKLQRGELDGEAELRGSSRSFLAVTMAVIKGLLGIEAKIIVNNKRVGEWLDIGVEEEGLDEATANLQPNTKTVCKFVETITDQEFSVFVNINRQYKRTSPSLGFDIFVDGVEIATKLFQQSALNADKSWSLYVHGVHQLDPKTSTEQVRPFKFCQIETLFDDGYLAKVSIDKKLLSKTGEVKIEIHRRSEAQLSESYLDFGNDNLETPSKVHEKTLKGQAKSHGASLGTSRPVLHKTSFWSSPLLDKADSPLGVFKFKYRSRKELEQLHIIPRRAEPEPKLVQKPKDNNQPISGEPIGSGILDGLTHEQRIKIEQYAAELRGTKIKREENDDENPVASKKPKLSKKSKEESKVTIDLTDD